jgi:hypothetical protein
MTASFIETLRYVSLLLQVKDNNFFIFSIIQRNFPILKMTAKTLILALL